MHALLLHRRVVIAGLLGLLGFGSVPVVRAQCRGEQFRGRATVVALRRTNGAPGRGDALVRSALTRRRARIAECYRNLLALNAIGRESGELRLHFAVGADGTVAGAPTGQWTVQPGDARAPEDDGTETEQRIAACVATAVRDLRFARSAAGGEFDATVRLAYDHTPAAPCGDAPPRP